MDNSVPLPSNLPNTIPSDSEFNAAYDRCAALQARAPILQLDPPRSPSTLICARILGYMLIYAPGRHNIAKDISKCVDDNELLHLAQLTYDYFIYLFNAAKSQTHEYSFLDHTSGPSFHTIKAAIAHIMEESPIDQRTVKAHALARDNFHCVVTGAIDYVAYHNNKQLTVEALAQELQVFHTEAVHIFPAFTNKGEDNLKPEYAANEWTIVNHFAGHDISQELDGIQIHCLENILTLAIHVQPFFDRLALWFEEVDTHQDTQHTYQVCGNPASICSFSPIVTFTTSDPLHLPLPSPYYLGIHAAFCKVANLSGATDCIGNAFEDMEEISTLASDGSSADTLYCALICALLAKSVF
ncbi:hypothetical protein EV424DRAFT_1598328 [Suillus variegatus]|nr:hypothetical protein EV424DRAFT_1598328 [Suillus variegatus]